MYGKLNVSRGLLPHSFQFDNWNNGLFRGSLKVDKSIIGKKKTSSDRNILVYGAGGFYLTDSIGKVYEDFNKGLPEGADSRKIRNVVVTRSGKMFAVASYDLYAYEAEWKSIPTDKLTDVLNPRFTDIAVRGDSLIVLGRSNIYLSLPPYDTFEEITIKSPHGYKGEVTLFRLVWLLHNGELFGIPGKVFIDLVGLLFIFLSISGIIIWIAGKGRFPKLFRWNFKWHEKLGRWTIAATIFMTLTGWALRPPFLIALVKNTVKPIPYTVLDSDNAWYDKLRMIIYDETHHDWIMSTSSGFYSLKNFEDVPKRLKGTPPVSAMGLNVMKRVGTNWLLGSFSGMFTWNREKCESFDYFTGSPAPKHGGAPFGKVAIAGYSDDFAIRNVVCTYDKGILTEQLPQPEEMRTLPISVWSLALEVHTGRIYTFMCGAETLIFIFVSGLVVALILWSGWKLRIRKKCKK